MESYENYSNIFYDYEPIYISEKLPGYEFKAGWIRRPIFDLGERILDFFGLLPKWLFHFDYDGSDLVDTVDLSKRIPKGYLVHGIVSDGKLYIYDIQNVTTGKYLDYFRVDYEQLISPFVPNIARPEPEQLFPLMCYAMQLERVPELYVGPFRKNIVESFRKGVSNANEANNRLGIVIKPQVEKDASFGRKVLKYLNPDF